MRMSTGAQVVMQDIHKVNDVCHNLRLHSMVMLQLFDFII